MQNMRNPNIVLIRQRLRKEIVKIPLGVERLEIHWMGPLRKNFDIPKDEEKRLNKKVTRGKAEFTSSYLYVVRPASVFGKNPSVANSIAKEIFT